MVDCDIYYNHSIVDIYQYNIKVNSSSGHHLVWIENSADRLGLWSEDNGKIADKNIETDYKDIVADKTCPDCKGDV